MATAKMSSFTIPLHLQSEALTMKHLLSRMADISSVLAYTLRPSTHDQPDPVLFMKCYGFAKIKVLIPALPINK